MQRIGRPAEVQGFGDGEEAIELAQIHGAVLSGAGEVEV